MHFTADMGKTVAFVCIKLHNGMILPKGTAFFIGNVHKYQVAWYVVTAKHVIDGANARALKSVFITYNSPEGKQETEIPVEDWHYHPNDSSQFIDVAAARFPHVQKADQRPRLPNPSESMFWHMNSLVAANERLSPGQEVGITGLFIHHVGVTRNFPIVRTGIVAAIPDEPIQSKMGPIKAFLIEVRSVGGLSGSPVFTVFNGNQIRLIGLIHGHFDQLRSSLDNAAEDETPEFQAERINSGIAIVVPASFIRETLQPLIAADIARVSQS